MTGVKLEKISDTGMYVFIEKGLRGRVSYIAKRHSKANHKYRKNYDPTKPSIYIPYLDMNNLFGYGMSNYLSYCGFNWLKNLDKFDVNSTSEKSSTGSILQVNREYADELHALHNDYPLAPEKLAIPYEMLSDYCKKNTEEYRTKVGDIIKLIPNLGNKTNYVLHYRNFQWYLFLGMKLTKIHKVLKFKGSDWMKKYNDF